MTDAADNVQKRRVLIIDDEIQIRRFLRISLASEGYEVLEAATAEAGITKAATQNPDLIVLDLGLPGTDGTEVLTEIRSWSSAPVIILSVRDNEQEKVATLDAGANDYVTKPFGLQEFLARARNLMRSRDAAESAEGYYDDGHLLIDMPQRRVAVAGEDVRLTRKEFDVLRMLFTSRNHVVTQTHLLREIWGPTHSEDTHYLRIIVARLRQKLGDDATEPHYLHTEPGVGYRLTTTPAPE